MDAQTLGERIKTGRETLGLTQDQVAGKAGVSRAFISQIESGTRWPRLDNLLGIASSINVDPGDLITDHPVPRVGNHVVVDALIGAAGEVDGPILRETLQRVAAARPIAPRPISSEQLPEGSFAAVVGEGFTGIDWVVAECPVPGDIIIFRRVVRGEELSRRTAVIAVPPDDDNTEPCEVHVFDLVPRGALWPVVDGQPTRRMRDGWEIGWVAVDLRRGL